MALPASLPPLDPLSHSRAGFSNHAGRSKPMNVNGHANGNGYHEDLDGSDAESSKDAQAREAASKDRESRSCEDSVDGDWRQELMLLDKIPSPRINPFHLLSHPDSTAALPPLPPHLQALASDTGDPQKTQNGNALMEETHNLTIYQTTSQSPNSVEPQIHVTKVTKDTVHIIPGAGSEMEAHSRPAKLIQKVSNVFKRDGSGRGLSTADGMAEGNGLNGHMMGNGMNASTNGLRSPVVMQGPPPSPPLSEGEVEVTGSEDSHRISLTQSDGTETTVERTTIEESDGPNTTLMPVTELTEIVSNPQPNGNGEERRTSIYTTNLTAEPADLANSSPISVNSSQPPPVRDTAKHGSSLPGRRVSAGSTSSRTGSLAVVRSGRMAPQRRSSANSVEGVRQGGIPQEERGGSLEPNLDAPPGTYGTGLGLGLVPGGEASQGPRSQVVSEGWEPPSLRNGDVAESSTSSPTNATNPSFLHPSSAIVQSGQPLPRISRRSTNPSPLPINTTLPTPRSPLMHSQSTYHSPQIRARTSIPGIDGAALDSDILAQAETIRRERLERRQKKMNASAEAGNEMAEVKEDAGGRGAADVKVPKREATTDDPKVLVGSLIGEDHVNYVLMYNMLTGIRIGVSRCQAKIKRPLTDEDFLARHKFSFDIVGNELTPSARYDFKFKDYAPWVFRDLRDDHFHLDPADYLLSLTAKYILSELGSPGKSGSFFYFSRDYRFIIKTISHSEHKFLRSILKAYHDHIKTNPHTLLSRFYGLHRVKLPRGRKIHFVIMNNLFPPHRDIHETFDLKGSAYGREYPEEKAVKNPRAVLKDKNWVNRGRTLELGPEKRALLSEQLRRDMEFLKKMRVMDYSLLVGIHNMERGNRDNLRENSLTVFHPEMPVRRKPSAVKPSADASNARKAIRRSDPKMLDVASQLPSADSSDRRHFLFYQDEGGLRATDEANQNMDVIYYLGVIDICTPYNTVKRLEHFWKSMTEDRHTISAVEPVAYGQRFLNFLLSVMRGGDISLRPAGLLPIPPPDEKPVGEATTGDGQVPGLSHEVVHTDQGNAVVGHIKAE